MKKKKEKILYISELCEDCAVANEIDYEIDDA